MGWEKGRQHHTRPFNKGPGLQFQAGRGEDALRRRRIAVREERRGGGSRRGGDGV